MSEGAALLETIRRFLEQDPASIQAARPLKPGAQVGFRFVGVAGQYHVVKEAGGLRVREGAAARPDWTAEITPAAVTSIAALENHDIGDLGVEIFKRMARGFVEPGSDDHIKVHLQAGFLTIMRHGYLGILPLGGPKVARYLAQHGLKNASAIRKVFRKLRGSEN